MIKLIKSKYFIVLTIPIYARTTMCLENESKYLFHRVILSTRPLPAFPTALEGGAETARLLCFSPRCAPAPG